MDSIESVESELNVEDSHFKSFDEYYNMVYFCHLFSGQAYIANAKNRVTYKKYTTIVLLLTISGISLLLYNIILLVCEGNINKSVQIFSVAILLLASVIRILLYNIWGEEIQSLKIQINDDYKEVLQEKLKYYNIVKEGAASAVKFQIINISSGIYIATMFPSKSAYQMIREYLTKNICERYLIIDFRFPFINNDYLFVSPFYELSYIYSLLIMFYNILTFIDFDTTVILYVNHICTQMELLSAKLLDIFEDQSENNYNAEEVHNRIKKIVQKHHAIMNSVALIQKIYYPYFYFAIQAAAFEMCILLFIIAEEMRHGVFLYDYLPFLVALFIDMYLLSVFGDKLIDKSYSVGVAAYSVNWEIFSDLTIRRDLMLIMRRSQRPIIIKSFFAEISLEQFGNMVSAAWSYFTLIRSAQE